LQRGEQAESNEHADPFGDYCRQQRHEDHHDGDAVPDQAGISRLEMVVGGAERSEDQAGEHYEVEPALAVIRECSRARFGQEDQAADSDDCEGDIGDDISEVWDAEPTAVVGEVVIGQRLRNPGKE
jgi:hypothetical protein